MFRSQNHIDEIKGVYVPFWLFDSDADAQLRFTATRTRCWSDSKYDYTETNYYSVRRDGTLGFDAVPVDGSSKIEDDLMESIEPFRHAGRHPLPDRLSGGLCGGQIRCERRGQHRAGQQTHPPLPLRRRSSRPLPATIRSKVDNSSIQLHGGKAKYALFPVWLLSTSWRGENYLFAMNGQTGKFVGDLPVDKGRCPQVDAGPYGCPFRRVLRRDVAAVAGTDPVKEGRTMKKTSNRLHSLFAALAALILAAALAVPAFAVEGGFADLYYRMFDDAEVLTEDEDNELEDALEELSLRQSFDVTIATIESLESVDYDSMEALCR